jgi:hypothetical protein
MRPAWGWHGVSTGMGLGLAWDLAGGRGPGMGPVQKITREQRKKKRRAAGLYLLRWRWANNNNPLQALPSKHPIPADLFITDPTCSIAGRD